MAALNLVFTDTSASGRVTYAPGEVLAIGAAPTVAVTVAPTATGTGAVELIPDVDCRVAIGANPDPTAASAIPIRAGQTVRRACVPGDRIAVIAGFAGAPTSSADPSGGPGEIRVSGNDLFYKAASGWRRLSGATF